MQAVTVKNIFAGYGRVPILKDITLSVETGERHVIIGPNGAGKTTFFRALCGELKITAGSILFEGRDVSALSGTQRVRAGMGRSFQVARIFSEMTPFENVVVALEAHHARPSFRIRPTTTIADTAKKLLDDLGLSNANAMEPASILSHGDKKRLELAMMLALRPRLMLLDEPTAGMAAGDRQSAVRLIARIVEQTGATLILTEHDMDVVFNLGPASVCCITARSSPAARRKKSAPTLSCVTSISAAAATMPSAPLLEIGPLDAFYGDSHILHAVALTVGTGEGVALLGRNGAGKSTLLKTLLDAGPRAAGPIRFAGTDLAGLATHRRARLGLALVPEDRRIFPHVTVAENLTMARHACAPGIAPRSAAEIAALFPMLQPILQRRADRLSGGQQQMVAVGRGLVPRPSLLMLDEPAEGLAPRIVEELAEEITRVRRTENFSVLITEQNIDFARACTDRLYLIDSGAIVFHGDWAEFDAHPDLVTRYLAL